MAAKTTAEAVDADVAILFPDDRGELRVRASALTGDPGGSFLSPPNEWAVATWVLESGRVAGRGTGTLEGPRGLYVPLEAEGKRGGEPGLTLVQVDLVLKS
ncbi:MAG: hypothetical protein ACM3XZ_05650 [Betaproteobacteria bacterium]